MKNRPGINIVHGRIPATEEVITFYHSQDAFQIYEAFCSIISSTHFPYSFRTRGRINFLLINR